METLETFSAFRASKPEQPDHTGSAGGDLRVLVTQGYRTSSGDWPLQQVCHTTVISQEENPPEKREGRFHG